ncbi:MAG: S8 family serine peptidase [Pseudomonadota bacterium]
MTRYCKQRNVGKLKRPMRYTMVCASLSWAIGAAILPSSTVAAVAVQAAESYPDQDRGYAIVVLKGESLSTAVSTKPISGRKIDFQSSAVQLQRTRLATERASYRRWLLAKVPNASVTNEFELALNAVSVRLNGATLAQIAAMPNVKQVSHQSLFHKVAATVAAETDSATGGASQTWQQNATRSGASSNANANANAGAGVKVAVIDSGIDVSHPCFSDLGYAVQPRIGDARFINNKVIAARAFTNGEHGARLMPEATGTHGTHVSGTIACNAATAATVGGVSVDKMSGIAPRALLGNYNVFPGAATTARSEDILNAMEAAYRDGFDVVNFSLNAGQRSGSGIEIRALRNLDRANMLFAVAPGKSEETRDLLGTDIEIEPKESKEENVALAVIRSSGAEYLGVRAAFGVVPVGGLTGPLALVLDASADIATTGGLGQACTPIRRFSLTGSIALIMRGTCDFTTKLRNVEAAGAVGAIVVAEAGQPLTVMGANDDAVQPTIPAFMVSLADRSSLQDNRGIATMLTQGPVDSIDPVADARSKIFNGFTSLTPQVTDARVESALSNVALQILSSAPATACATPPCFALMRGTSMVSAHLAGAAAALRARYPAWSAAEVRSAMANTALLSQFATKTVAATTQKTTVEETAAETNLNIASTTVDAPSPVVEPETFAELSAKIVNR